MAIGPILGGVGALLGGGSSLLSGLFGGKSSSSGMEDAINQAGKYQYMASQQALQAQQDALERARTDMAPFLQAGRTGLGQYMNMLGLGSQGTGYDPTAWLQKTPGYQWMMGQGVNALDRSAAAGGLLKSGAQYRGLMDYGQNLATTKAYDPYMNRLSGLGTMGQQAAGMQGGWGLGAASNMSNLLMQQGQNQANSAEQLGMANLLGSQQNWNKAMGGLGIIQGTLQNPMFSNALGKLWNRGMGSGLSFDPYSVGQYQGGSIYS
jgi:hypothetical protein